MFAVCVYQIYNTHDNTRWAYEEMSRRTAGVLGYKSYWEHPELPLSLPADIPVPATVSQSYIDLFSSYRSHWIFRKHDLWPFGRRHWDSNSSDLPTPPNQPFMAEAYINICNAAHWIRRCGSSVLFSTQSLAAGIRAEPILAPTISRKHICKL